MSLAELHRHALPKDAPGSWIREAIERQAAESAACDECEHSVALHERVGGCVIAQCPCRKTGAS